MNCKLFIIVVFLNESTLTDKNEHSEKIDFIDKVKTAFDDKTTFQCWLESRHQKHEIIINVVKEFVIKLKDILSVIDKREYRKLKKMIIKSELLFSYKTGYPYLETRILVNSICSILKHSKIFKKGGLDKCFEHACEMYHLNDLYEKNINYKATSRDNSLDELLTIIVFNEYEYMYSYVIRDMNKMLKSHAFKDNNLHRIASLLDTGLNKNENNTDLLLFSINNPRKIIEDVMNVDNTNKAYVFVSKDGLTSSHKGLLKIEPSRLFFEQSPLCKDHEVRELKSTYSKYGKLDENYLRSTYMCNSFVFNLSATRLLIPLIHFFTMIVGKNSKYKIYLNEKGLYVIKWSFVTEFNKNLVINNFFSKKFSFDFFSKDKICGAAFLSDHFAGCSTIKSEDERTTAFKTRIMLLSCGHQLGSEMSDYFFKYNHDEIFKSFCCPICESLVRIIGSHDVAVCKKSNKRKITDCLVDLEDEWTDLKQPKKKC